MIGITTSGLTEKYEDYIQFIREYGLNSIDCSITGMLKKSWDSIETSDVVQLGNDLRRNNIKVWSLQSVFYGKDWSFANKNDFDAIFDHINTLIKFSKILDTKRILFGSPQQRSKMQSSEDFISLLTAVDQLMIDNDMIFNIETMPKIIIENDIFGNSVQNISKILISNKFQNLKICQHSFFDELENFNYSLVDSYHFSTKLYDDNLDKIAKQDVEKIKNELTNFNIEFKTNNLRSTLCKIQSAFDL